MGYICVVNLRVLVAVCMEVPKGGVVMLRVSMGTILLTPVGPGALFIHQNISNKFHWVRTYVHGS